jgi:hypothetical protein
LPQLVAVAGLLQALQLGTKLLVVAHRAGSFRLVMAETLFRLQAFLNTLQPEEQDGAEMGLV